MTSYDKADIDNAIEVLKIVRTHTEPDYKWIWDEDRIMKLLINRDPTIPNMGVSIAVMPFDLLSFLNVKTAPFMIRVGWMESNTAVPPRPALSLVRMRIWIPKVQPYGGIDRHIWDLIDNRSDLDAIMRTVCGWTSQVLPIDLKENFNDGIVDRRGRDYRFLIDGYKELRDKIFSEKTKIIKAKMKFGIPVDVKEVDNRTIMDLL